MPNSSLSTLAIGARQLVVHDALEMTWWLAGSYSSWLTPITMVMSSLEAGAEMMTLLAPASMCACALVASVKKPVDSTTTSAPISPHFRLLGSRSAYAAISWSPTLIVVSVDDTSASSRPRIVSNLSRWARVLLSVRSLTPTISMSAPDARTARKKLRPMRPKPLMPTRTVTEALFPWRRWSEVSLSNGVERSGGHYGASM